MSNEQENTQTKVTTSLKNYYANLQTLYTNAVNMLMALNQSLTSNSSNVYVNLVDNSGNVTNNIQIPSLLYLESKLEELETNFSTLFNITESGEAWFNKASDMIKLQLVKSSSAPVTPEISNNELYASIKANNVLKDLVSPKMFLKVGIGNLPENSEKLLMKKIVINDSGIFNRIKEMNLTSYEEIIGVLYTLRNGIDYEEYESTIDLPIKRDKYVSDFKILEIPELDGGNPRKENSNSNKLTYTLRLSSLQYHDSEDSSIEYTLKKSDLICLGNTPSVYIVKKVNVAEDEVDIEEYIGHTNLTTYEENTNMVLKIYNSDYKEYDYAEIPLEENQYLCLFIGIIYNNIRSSLSTPILLDMSTIYMYDKNGTKIYDSNGNHMTYLEYYDKYCNNIGDLILGLTESAYPQISNYTNDVIYNILYGDNVKEMVTASISEENQLQVVPINKHLIDNTTSEQIINLHSQKNNINSELNNLKDNIDNINNTLITTDFSQEIDITQESLQAQLKDYYSQRITLQKQLNSIVDNINAVSADVTIGKEKTKYRIRGISNPEILENYLHTFGNYKLDIIGLECEYKYKSVLKDSTAVMNINSNLFTDWNRINNIDKQRNITFNTSINSFSVDYVDYSSTKNIIKWNQIDIPINKGEDVVIRIRYKYNIGQPFINLYSPWSDEMTIMFPVEYSDSIEISTIIDTNENDTISAKFNETLINDGYQEHVNNSLTVGDNKFYHMPENIYSGFNTPENNMINLKDKLTELSKDLNDTKSLIESELNKKYTVYLSYDEGNYELSSNSINKINIWNNEHINDSFVKKKMNLIIKNTGDTDIRLYSIFPGNTDIPLLLSNNEFYEQKIRHYERVPMFINNILSYQTLGQCIYFRQDNAFTGECVYFNDSAQNLQDYRMLTSNAANMYFSALNSYMKQDYSQVLLGYRKRNTGEIRNIIDVSWIGLDWQEDGNFRQLMSTMDIEEADYTNYSRKGIDFFLYKNDLSNNYLARFEDICGVNELGDTIYLDEHTSISDFITINSVNGIQSGTASFTGAFFYVDMLNRKPILTDGNEYSYVSIGTGKSIVIPLVFEYSLDGVEKTKITKALYFDLRDSLGIEPTHFMIELTANYDYSSSGSVINNGFII